MRHDHHREELRLLYAACEAAVDAERPDHWMSCLACCLGVPHKHIPVIFDAPVYTIDAV